MSAFVQNTKRLFRAFNVSLVAFALLLSSGNHFCEECQQEIETVEVEMLLVHRDERPTGGDCHEREIKRRFSFSRVRLCLARETCAVDNERGNVNGLGTYLLI